MTLEFWVKYLVWETAVVVALLRRGIDGLAFYEQAAMVFCALVPLLAAIAMLRNQQVIRRVLTESGPIGPDQRAALLKQIDSRQWETLAAIMSLIVLIP